MKESLLLLPKDEGYLVEFKDFSGGISSKELSITICAFANSDGGSIYIGVTDSGEIQGIRITPTILDKIQNSAREGCSPPVPVSLREQKANKQKSVLEIVIKKSGHLHTTASGKTYIRVGFQDKKVVGDELLKLAETKSQLSYEEKRLDIGTETLDLNSINQYYEARKKITNVRSNLTPEDVLTKIGLAEKKEGNYFIHAGAFILFGKQGDQTLLQRDFTFVRYDVEGRIYSYREDLTLPITDLMDRLMELIRPHNHFVEGIKNLRRIEKEIYPEEAIREALLNAFAHRDYRLLGLKNECRLYPNRLEIISAGGLPSMITLENLGSRHYSRNPKIMHALLIYGFVEELGEGINLMKKALKKNGNPPPKFIASDDQFKVIFFKKTPKRNRENFKETVENYLETNPTISRRELEGLTGLGSTSAKYMLQDWIKKGFLEQVGKGPQARYQKK